MSEFDENKIRRLDLTVLLIFLGLMRARKASDVAGQLGLTNSSISHALRRLRDVFDDELFMRRPHGLEPTSFALAIEPDIRRSVEAIQAALVGPPEFDPAGAQATLRVAANDREMATLVPSVFAAVADEAPHLDMAVQSLARDESLQRLADGSLDFAIGFYHQPGAQFESHAIRTEAYLVAARKDHRIWRNKLTLDTYTQHKHVLVSGDGSLRGIVDQTLEEQGVDRRVCLAVPSFLAALSILSRSDFVATLPAGLVKEHAGSFGLRHAEPPLDIRSFSVTLLTHRRNAKSPLHQWCIGKFQQIASQTNG
ncbi:MAG: LysR family transcriptional regulator [Pseudomonadota bacterium]